MITLIFGACSTPHYLPQSEVIDINAYGSFIKISLKNKEDIKGELLAADPGNLTVLTDTNFTKKVIIVPLASISKFSLIYASPKKYGWSIPLFAVSTIVPFPDPEGGGLMPFHGFYSLLTLPVNLIVTSAVTRNAFRYNNTTITYEQLKMFARYPQGIPSNISIKSIK
jgi:hypothetical protein